ncbi:MAG: hypothetical protein ACFE0I_04395 [Elainellaceae cyanobacterium]
MPYENISATISDESLSEIKGAIATIRSHLSFLISLTPDERRKRFKMGDKSLAFVRNSVTVTQNNPEVLPGNFNRMASSLLVYDFVKAAAKHSPGLKSVADQLGERFKSISGRRPKSDPTTV